MLKSHLSQKCYGRVAGHLYQMFLLGFCLSGAALCQAADVKPVAGNYRALVQAPAPNPTLNAQAGLLSLTVTRSGLFTGRILLHQGQVRVVRGQWGPAGYATFGRDGSSSQPLAVVGLPLVGLQLQWVESVDGRTLTGALVEEGGARYAEILGGLASYTAARRPQPPLENLPADFRGRFTVALTPQPPAQAADTQANPTGSGVASLSVLANGLSILVGRMPDNTVISYAGPLLTNFYLPLYIPTYGRRGSLSGFARINPNEVDSDIAGNLYWSAPDTQTSEGWQGVPVALVGSVYKGQGFLGLAPSTQLDYSAHLDITGAGFHGADVSLRIDHGIGIVPHDTSLKLKLDRHTGFITGTYVSFDGIPQGSFLGVVISKQSSAYGYFTSAPGHPSIVIAPAKN